MKRHTRNSRYLNGWEQVIFRNYSFVQSSALAEILGTDEEHVEKFAKDAGIDKFRYNPLWKEKGFVTLIRNNWDLLPNDKIAKLLGVTESEFYSLLKEYDFLDVKLGEKPEVTAPVYGVPPSDAEKLAAVKRTVDGAFFPQTAAPFDFYGDGADCTDDNAFSGDDAAFGEVKGDFSESGYAVKDRFTSNYCAKYTDVLLDGELKDYSDEYLERLRKTGVNGVWLHETLKNLAPFPFDERFSPDYNIRIKNLARLTERCAKYGVGVYIYLNEPRTMPKDFFDEHPELRGQKVADNEYCLCTSSEKVKEYIFGAVKFVTENVPLLKGLFTITMSENPTHCYSRDWGKGVGVTDCPVCRERKPYEIVAELNNLMCRAAKAGNPDVSYISNIWGWAEYMGWSMDDTLSCISLLDKNVDVMSVSEFDKEFSRGGTVSRVIDYSISVAGPSEYTVRCLEKARETGHRIWAKIQVNNSWECSAVPYLPVFDLMTEHVENLKKIGVSGLMLGWSLGGYPGGALSACTRACRTEKFDLSEFCKEKYGAAHLTVEKAMKEFDDAFRNYPFSVNSLYEGAQTLGPANLWSLDPDGRKSTMVCLSFDDYETWSAPYGLRKYIELYEKLCEKWERGLKLLEKESGNAAYEEYETMARASYVHFNSALLHAKFVELKTDVAGNTERIKDILKEEYENVTELLKLVAKDAKIGFEMTNHYYYTPLTLIEKLLNVNEMLSLLP